MEEKRVIERYCLSVPAKVKVLDNPKINGLKAYTKDVSSAGTYLTMEKQLKAGQRVELELFISINKLQDFFEMDNQVRIEVTGEVIRSDESGVGIQFDKKYTIIPINKHNIGEDI